MTKPSRREMQSVTFLHPDLGLGGAERLIIDAALALQELGYDVRIVTAHYDPTRCFEETKTELRGKVLVAGDFIPRHVAGGKFHLFFAIIRTVFAGLRHVVFSSSHDASSSGGVLVVDQVAFAVPVFRLLTNLPIVFYCHFPDKLLAPSRGGLARRLYRKLFDRLEESATGAADQILVNSLFTQSVYATEFPSLSSNRGNNNNNNNGPPMVLYPCVSLEAFDQPFSREVTTVFASRPPELVAHLKSPSFVFILSINRFERKKGLALAIRALKAMTADDRETHLLLAGGYDPRLAENVEHLEELKCIAENLALTSRVWFLPSCTNEEKRLLLDLCRALVYTPEREHFGIVPIEACACSRPVVAVNSGGPLESIVHDSTGFLVAPTPSAFADALARFTSPRGGRERAAEFGRRGRDFVRDRFSRKTFGKELERVCKAVYERSLEDPGFRRSRRNARVGVLLLVLAGCVLLLAMTVHIW